MTANKHSDVRAAIAWIPEIATLARQHNNANILCIPARFVSDEQAIEIIDCFFKSGFEGGRHARRVSKIACAMMASLVWMTASWSQTEAVPQQVVDVKLSQDDLRQHLSILASDVFEGRETGEAGQKKAAYYLEAYYADLGFEPCNNGSFFQKVPLENNQILGGSIVVLGDTLLLGEEFFLFPGLDVTQFTDEPMTFVGYGIQSKGWNDYKKFEGGGLVVILDGEPVDEDGNFVLTKNGSASEWSEALSQKREIASEMGALGVIVVLEDDVFKVRNRRMSRWMKRKSTTLIRDLEGEGTNIPTLFVAASTAEEWLRNSSVESLSNYKELCFRGKSSRPSVLSPSLNMSIERVHGFIDAENVLAFFEGSDPELKDEILVITSHYDHVGIIDGEIHNGADDDGSGTVTVMEMARLFVRLSEEHGIRPKRSILFMNVVGEEKGLLGSEYYADHPVFPLENTIANLNIDMIGRTDENHPDDPRYVYLIGADKLSSELHEISEYCNETYTNLALDYTFNAPDDPNRFYYRSDHYNFAKNNIPVIFYFTGVHEDYHKPGDDVEKIMFPKMAEIGKLVFHTAWELANTPERIKVDRINDFPSDR